MKITLDHLRAAARRPINEANARSVLVALDRHGARFGLDQPHRATQLLAQLLHESAEFCHDREIWGPTPAQERYDVRTDLGNTPERDGDGKRYMGRTGMQITGKANYAAFRDWCRANVDPAAPDFVAHPELVNTDPWEGLGPLWYWSTRKLNRYADAGDVETITKRINGGLNGFADRLDYLARVSLVLLGYRPQEVRAFQRKAQAQGLLPMDEPGKPSQVDGDAGPKTRAALHRALLALTGGDARSAEVKAAPVVEEVPVAPPALDKPVTQTGGFWERLISIGTAGSGLGALLFGDWRVTAAALAGVIVIGALGLIFHARIIAAVKAIKAAGGGAMSALWAGLRFVAGALPWQAWAALALALGVAAYGCSERRAGERGAREEIHQSNEAARDKADGAERRVQDCTGVWDRSGGFCVPDRAGR